VTYIRSLEEIPRFENEAAEAEFWATHSLAKIWSRLERAWVSGIAAKLISASMMRNLDERALQHVLCSPLERPSFPSALTHSETS